MIPGHLVLRQELRVFCDQYDPTLGHVVGHLYRGNEDCATTVRSRSGVCGLLIPRFGVSGDRSVRYHGRGLARGQTDHRISGAPDERRGDQGVPAAGSGAPPAQVPGLPKEDCSI